MLKYIQNTGTEIMYILGQMILPGEGAHVDVPHEAEPQPEEPAAPTLADEVKLELKKSVKDLVAGLATYNDDTLTLMVALEQQAASPRTSLLSPLQAEVLRRADAALTAGQTGGAQSEPGSEGGNDTQPGGGTSDQP